VHVVATAGHVDHGKSTLVRALTGMEPDRWAEERRRGMTIDLGFAWTRLPSGAVLAFVDVPGHHRFVPNMLAGVGPVPTALVVVAADEGWMPQSAEHLAALDALGVRNGLLVVTRSDLAAPGPAMSRGLAEFAATSLGTAEAVAVSGMTGAGLDALFAALDRLVAGLPPPVTEGPVRLWVDRAFTIRGSGTVVTATLGAGTLRVGDELELHGEPVRVRGLQSLGAAVAQVSAVARVAVNLRAVPRDRVGRGDALVTPGRFHQAGEVDVRLHAAPDTALPPTVILHVGSAAVPVRVRPLGSGACRLQLSRALPLRVGDRALLRDPGGRDGLTVLSGITVLDVVPPALRRRGAAVTRAAVLSTMDGKPDEPDEVRRRGMVRRADLERMGVPATGTPVAGDWLADPEYWLSVQQRLTACVAEYGRAHPLEPGAPVEALRHLLDLPDRALVEAAVTPPLVVRDGRIRAADAGQGLPPALAEAVSAVLADLEAEPFRAPEAARLAALGLGPRELGAAVRSGALMRVAGNVVLLPDAVQRAADVLAGLPQPFTLSQAREALGSTRRVAVPLLELLDSKGVTCRLPDDRRTVA
jgi:selenocysteine-specific elongation factor